MMNLTGYTMSLDSLINRHIFLIVTEVVLMLLMIVLSWLAPYVDSGIKKKRNKPKTKRKAEIIKKKKRNTLILQVVLTFISIVISVFGLKNEVERLTALRIDANSNSIAVYEGQADLQMNVNIRRTVFSELLVDYRVVTFAGSDEVYWIDMSKTDEGWVEDWGDFSGKITYGEHSKVIFKIE